jgi:hypothetical protein
VRRCREAGREQARRNAVIHDHEAQRTGSFDGSAVGQTQPRQKIDVSKLGPQVGERVPDFSLKDQTGKTWTLPSIMGPKGAMLVFLRSADW